MVVNAEPMIDEKEVAKITGLSLSYLRVLRVYGAGPSFVKLGHLVRYHPSDVRQWVRAREESKSRRQKAATKDDLRREIGRLRRVGQQMANLCFNLGQPNSRVLRGMGEEASRVADNMWELAREWDRIRSKEGGSVDAETIL